jgi:DNA-binding winged helix-turn-helix (wHTH) protein
VIKTFGEFEFDDTRRTLKHRGTTLKLTGQALELLFLLLERPGDLITREEIHQKLWPDTNVEFEHSLDVVVSRLRTAIPDSIQTVPRRGYRFSESVTVQPDRPARWLRRSIRYATVAVLAALAAILFARSRYDKAMPHPGSPPAAARK